MIEKSHLYKRVAWDLMCAEGIFGNTRIIILRLAIESENVKYVDVCKESAKLVRTGHERVLTSIGVQPERVSAKGNLAPADKPYKSHASRLTFESKLLLFIGFPYSRSW